MSYTLTLTREERKAIDWIGNRYWHGDDFRKLLWVSCPDPVAVAEDGKWHLVEKDGDEISIEWDSKNDLQFTIPENVAWEIRERIEDEDGDNLACFSHEFILKLYEFCSHIV